MTEVYPFKPVRNVPLRELVVDGVKVKIFDTDAEVFLGWINTGDHPVYFTCEKCKYRGTARLSDSDVAYAATGGTYLTCPTCNKEIELRIPQNSHKLTREALTK